MVSFVLRAFALSRQYEKEYLLWYQHMREVLCRIYEDLPVLTSSALL